MKIIYEASDGTHFETDYLCKEYEKQMSLEKIISANLSLDNTQQKEFIKYLSNHGDELIRRIPNSKIFKAAKSALWLLKCPQMEVLLKDRPNWGDPELVIEELKEALE